MCRTRWKRGAPPPSQSVWCSGTPAVKVSAPPGGVIPPGFRLRRPIRGRIPAEDRADAPTTPRVCGFRSTTVGLRKLCVVPGHRREAALQPAQAEFASGAISGVRCDHRRKQPTAAVSCSRPALRLTLAGRIAPLQTLDDSWVAPLPAGAMVPQAHTYFAAQRRVAAADAGWRVIPEGEHGPNPIVRKVVSAPRCGRRPRGTGAGAPRHTTRSRRTRRESTPAVGSTW